MIVDGKKYCPSCSASKLVIEFYTSKRGDGLRGQCKICEQVRDKKRDRHKNRTLEGHLYFGAKDRARVNNMEFSITIKDIVVPDICPALGIPLFRSKGKPTDNSPSLDRLDSSKGYIKGNVNVISMKANRMKSNATLAELESLLAWRKKHSRL